MIKAIILDWSGVVSDDLNLVYETTNRIFKKLGKKFMSIYQFRESFDLPYMDFYRSLGIKDEKSKLDSMFKQIFIKSGKKPRPLPYAKKMLAWLKKKDIKLAVFSSHPQELLDEQIKYYGMGCIFSCAIGSVYDKRDFLNKLVEEMGALKEETLLVGDMAHDIEAGNLVGIRTAAVLSGYHTRKKLEEKEPNFIMNDIRDLKFVVDGCYA
jgi:phosphoglycolate phosphatase-like HAD superfamily hydrolase